MERYLRIKILLNGCEWALERIKPFINSLSNVSSPLIYVCGETMVALFYKAIESKG